MVFEGDPQCNLKDCCFSLQKEQDEELVIKGLQDQNKYLKDELKEIKRKFQEQNKTLDQLGQANRDAIEKLKKYLIEENIIDVISEQKNLWNWTGKYLEYIEIKNIPQKSDDVQQAGAGVEDSSNSSIKQPEEQPKESKHELVLVEEFKIEDEKLKKIIEKHTSEDSNLSLIKKQITKIGLFIDKHLNKIPIRFYNRNKYSQEQVIYRELATYLSHQGIKVISVNKNIAEWSGELINSIKHKFKPNNSDNIPILGLIYTVLPNGDKDKYKRTLIHNIQQELLNLKNNLDKDIFDENNLQQILNNLKEIQQFITKNLKEIAINFDLKSDLKLKEDLKKIPNNTLKDYLIDGKIIQIVEGSIWKWSQEFNRVITKLTRIVKEGFLPDYSLDFLEKELLKLDDLENRSYNQKLINTIKPKLKEVIEISLSGNEKKVKQKVSSFLSKDIMNLGKQIDKDLQPIDINYHNGKKFNIPNLEDTPVSEG